MTGRRALPAIAAAALLAITGWDLAGAQPLPCQEAEQPREIAELVFGRGIGALFPAAVGFLSAALPLGQAIAIFAIVAYILLFIAAFLLPETRGKILQG